MHTAQRYKKTLRRLALVLATLLPTTASIDAQGPPIIGGPGGSFLVGTRGIDNILDVLGPGDIDFLFDAPNPADGQIDLLNTSDGDALDAMVGGPEDLYLGDDGDVVRIFSRSQPGVDGILLWEGMFEDYWRLRMFFSWAQDRIRTLISLLDGPPAPGSWADTFTTVRDELAAVVPKTVNGLISFEETFGPLPDHHDDTPASPENCLTWFPSDSSGDSTQGGGDLLMTQEEYDETVEGLNVLLEYLILVSG